MTFDPANASVCARLIQEQYAGVPPTVTNAETDTQVFLQRDAGVVRICFPGTASRQDWKTDAMIRKTDWRAGRVHRGFAHAINSVLDDITARLQAEDRIIVAGHSLGGALAMLCADELARRGERIDAVYTFGQPRVGNWTFAAHYNAQLHDETWRIVNAGDPVPRVPFVFGTYKHAGTEVYLGDPGEVVVDHPWWTSARETVRAARGSSVPLNRVAHFNIPHHSLLTYLAKLEALA